MNHLLIDEIIEFVSSCDLETETLSLMSKVNQHIRNCAGCMDKVKAFQLVYDEFVQNDIKGDFKAYLNESVKKAKLRAVSESEKTVEAFYK